LVLLKAGKTDVKIWLRDGERGIFLFIGVGEGQNKYHSERSEESGGREEVLAGFPLARG
jgi:hypothetical protein